MIFSKPEQNGFRPKRSCEAHVFVANNTNRNCSSEKMNTYGMCYDLHKAFDLVNRDMILNEMLSKNID